MIYIDVTQDYIFYYNNKKAINDAVIQVIGQTLANSVPRINNNKSFGIMGAYDKTSGSNKFVNASSIGGITALVSSNLAEKILERAKYYCPVKTGKLRDSGRIEKVDDETYRIFFDCDYSWYVHEFTWKKHKYPTCAKFLTRAIQEVEAGFGGK